MEDPAALLGALQERTVQARLRTIEMNRALIEELKAVWSDLNDFADDYEDARPLREEVAADIAKLEKLDLTLDTEWLADAIRARRQAGTL